MISFRGYLQAGNNYINTNKISNIQIDSHTTNVTMDNNDTFTLTNGYRDEEADCYKYAPAEKIFSIFKKADETGFANFNEIGGNSTAQCDYDDMMYIYGKKQ